MKRHPLATLAFAAALASSHSYAQHHTHGEAQLFITYTDHQLQVEFTSPAMDLLGFEGEATSAAQQQAVSELKKSLGNPGALFTLTDNDCALQAHHSKLTQSHHSEVHAHYQFACAQKQAPGITLKLFKHFTSLHHVEGFAVINGKQQYRRLEPGADAWEF